MYELTQTEANNLYEIAKHHQIISAKLNTYSEQCQDIKIKKMFEQASEDAQNNIQRLSQLL